MTRGDLAAAAAIDEEISKLETALERRVLGMICKPAKRLKIDPGFPPNENELKAYL